MVQLSNRRVRLRYCTAQLFNNDLRLRRDKRALAVPLLLPVGKYTTKDCTPRFKNIVA